VAASADRGRGSARLQQTASNDPNHRPKANRPGLRRFAALSESRDRPRDGRFGRGSGFCGIL